MSLLVIIIIIIVIGESIVTHQNLKAILDGHHRLAFPLMQRSIHQLVELQIQYLFDYDIHFY